MLCQNVALEPVVQCEHNAALNLLLIEAIISLRMAGSNSAC